MGKIDWSVYAIIDKVWLGERSIQKVAEQIILGGAGVIQYRDKKSESGDFFADAYILSQVTRKHGIPLIINDRVDIAMAVGADGVHLGQEDLPVDVARKIVGDGMILGGSVHSLSEFEQMKEADYFGVGAVYTTSTKEGVPVRGIELIRQIRALTTKPIVGIGGITAENLSPVIEAGADGVAVISAILGAENVEKATLRIKEMFQRIEWMK